MTLLAAALAAVHVLGGATWFGAMAYSFAVLHPRAARYFAREPARFEELVTFLAAGARWKVLGAVAAIGASGVAVAVVVAADAGPAPGAAWTALVVAKGALLVAALAVFAHASWRLWPARVLALPEEVPGYQRRFRRVAVVLLALVGAEIVLGVAAQYAAR